MLALGIAGCAYALVLAYTQLPAAWGGVERAMSQLAPGRAARVGASAGCSSADVSPPQRAVASGAGRLGVRGRAGRAT